MTAALAGKSAGVQKGDQLPPGAATTWTSIIEVYEIGELPVERDTYDVTSHGASYYREYVLGLFVTSALTMSANYVAIQYDTLFDDVGSGTERWYRLVYPAPDNSTHEFVGFISNVSPVTPLDDRLTYNVTITVTGEITRGIV